MEVSAVTTCISLFMFVVFTVLLYRYFKSLFSYWNNKGVFCLPRPSLLGHYNKSFTSVDGELSSAEQLYDMLEDRSFGGMYELQTPVLVLKNLELIKQVMCKDFSYFPGKSHGTVQTSDPFSGSLPHLEGDLWKDVRSKLTPAFTPASIKNTFDQLLHCSAQLSQYMDNETVDGEYLDFEDVLQRFTTDAITSCALGIQSNALSASCKSDFLDLGREVVAGQQGLTVGAWLAALCPVATSLSAFSTRVRRFFCQLTTEVLDSRESSGAVGRDVAHALLQLRKQQRPDISDTLLAAQTCHTFYAGFHKVSSVMGACLKELGSSPDVQERLRQEILEAAPDGRLTWEAIHGMEYMDNVLAETLRLHPAEPLLSRVCGNTYTLPGTSLQLAAGTRVIIPLRAIQRDARYFAQPALFDPERFSSGHHLQGFLPFGQGPRMCIGYRLGLMQAKVGLATILSQWQVTTTAAGLRAQRICENGMCRKESGEWVSLARLEERDSRRPRDGQTTRC